MTTPIIALDIDGVLAEFTGPFLKLACGLHPRDVLGGWHTGGGQHSWNFRGLTTAQVDATWDYVYANPSWWSSAPAIPSTDEVHELAAFADDVGAHVEYITARGTARNGAFAGDIEVVTRWWLGAHGFPQHDHLTLAGDKAIVLDGLIDRLFDPEPRLLGFLDDRPTTASDLGALGYPVVVRDWPYNRDPVPDSVPRVYSLGEFVDLLRARQASAP